MQARGDHQVTDRHKDPPEFPVAVPRISSDNGACIRCGGACGSGRRRSAVENRSGGEQPGHFPRTAGDRLGVTTMGPSVLVG